MKEYVAFIGGKMCFGTACAQGEMQKGGSDACACDEADVFLNFILLLIHLQISRLVYSDVVAAAA